MLLLHAPPVARARICLTLLHTYNAVAAACAHMSKMLLHTYACCCWAACARMRVLLLCTAAGYMRLLLHALRMPACYYFACCLLMKILVT
jgi:hypothetical protein